MRSLFVLFCEAFCLFGYEFGIVEVVNAHGVAHFSEGFGSYAACFFCASAENVVDSGDVLLVLFASLADGFESVVEYVVEELLACAVTESSVCVVSFEFVEIFVFWQELFEVGVEAEGVEVCEYGVAFEVSGLFDVDVFGVSVHGVDLFLEFLRSVREVDAVAE